MASWWIFEVTHYTIVAFIPLVVFPLMGMGVTTADQVAPQYFQDSIMLILGSFILTEALTAVGLTKRLALYTVVWTGEKPQHLLAGAMCLTFALSMFISNTATAAMMTPICSELMANMCEGFRSAPGRSEDERARSLAAANQLAKGLLISIGFTAAIGGTATITGTAPNVLMVSTYDAQFRSEPSAACLQLEFDASECIGPTLDYGTFMVFALPLAVIMLVLTYVLLSLRYVDKTLRIDTTSVQDQINEHPPLSRTQILVVSVICFVVVLWLFRDPGFIGDDSGWSTVFPQPSFISDSTTVWSCMLLLFLIPSEHSDSTILDWPTVSKNINWGVLLLLGGGLALSQGLQDSGATAKIADQIASLDIDPAASLFVIMLAASTLSQVASNTAVSAIFVAILPSLAVTSELDPRFLMVPSIMSCSMSFWLPISNLGNAIAFSSGYFRAWTC
jgi:sodium-dependent dicarboxylate transporter 2/3/5